MRPTYSFSCAATLVLALAGCNAMTGIGDYTVVSADGGGSGDAAQEAATQCPKSCLDSATTCGAACAATETSCTSACTNQGCKNQCKMSADNCRRLCASTCQQCGNCALDACNSAAGAN